MFTGRATSAVEHVGRGLQTHQHRGGSRSGWTGRHRARDAPGACPLARLPESAGRLAAAGDGTVACGGIDRHPDAATARMWLRQWRRSLGPRQNRARTLASRPCRNGVYCRGRSARAGCALSRHTTFSSCPLQSHPLPKQRTPACPRPWHVVFQMCREPLLIDVDPRLLSLSSDSPRPRQHKHRRLPPCKLQALKKVLLILPHERRREPIHLVVIVSFLIPRHNIYKQYSKDRRHQECLHIHLTPCLHSDRTPPAPCNIKR